MIALLANQITESESKGACHRLCGRLLFSEVLELNQNLSTSL